MKEKYDELYKGMLKNIFVCILKLWDKNYYVVILLFIVMVCLFM